MEKTVERERMFAHSTDYRDREGGRRGTLLDRGFWIHHLPRPLLSCRALGHRPVVDGTTGTRPGRPGYRWVACDRCGLRPESLVDLDAGRWNIGDRYDQAVPPCMWPRATGTLGGQVIIGKSFSGASIGIAVGSAGDDHPLAANVRLNPAAAAPQPDRPRHPRHRAGRHRGDPALAAVGQAERVVLLDTAVARRVLWH
jgi:hypothetical protein